MVTDTVMHLMSLNVFELTKLKVPASWLQVCKQLDINLSVNPASTMGKSGEFGKLLAGKCWFLAWNFGIWTEIVFFFCTQKTYKLCLNRRLACREINIFSSCACVLLTWSYVSKCYKVNTLKCMSCNPAEYEMTISHVMYWYGI